jgi:acyl-CoA synthetase (NDP forming)
VRKLGVVTMTGGYASLSLDIATDEGLPVPELEDFGPWIRSTLPGITVPNPLDTTGLGSKLWPEIVGKYAATDELDSMLVIHPLADEDEESGVRIVRSFADAAASVAKPCVVANCSGVPAPWARPLAGDVLALGRGLRPSIRGLQTLGTFASFRETLGTSGPAAESLPRPAAPPIREPEGEMLPFDVTMRLLADHGIPVAPYAIIAPETEPRTADVPFGGPYVVKLADVAHRTEHGAVRLNVEPAALPEAIEGLRALAARDGLSPVVAIQPMVSATGEVLLGIQGESELGPLVAFGLGGIFAEALGKVGGRMAPFGREEAHALIDEFRSVKVMHGFRGRPPWDLDALAGILVAGRLAAGGHGWIASLDVNPLIYGPGGFQAVDALLLLKPA